ncbi:hypothetical protein TNCT_471721 [Trichonephila clavata]|uniref:Uncharacterized protein n=1 Tax=Trichonephila clavata TaxID=2740835 RepID=A0A8X6IL07_TRICU|nr:hypothetical protein TNCT_471721 [Trichonephila clavata]
MIKKIKNKKTGRTRNRSIALHRGLYRSNLDFEALDGAGRRQLFTITSPVRRNTRTRHPSGHARAHSRIISKSDGTPERSSHDTTPPRRLPVDLENFTSPKPLLLATSCSTRAQVSLRRPIHSELLATFLHLSRRRGSRHRGPHEPAPSSGGPRKISKSKAARSRHHLPSSSPLALPFNTDSILSRLPHEPRTHSTSPDGLAPVTRARTRRRPLPVDLEKFRSPLPLSHQTRSTYLRASHVPCSTSPVTGARMPSSGGLLDTLFFFFFFLAATLQFSGSPLREPLPQKERGRRRSQRVLRTRDESQ